MKKISLLILVFIPLFGYCQDSLKTQYSLFKPTPKNLMRSFETDRPDVTESAYTVDAGHFQLETDIFKYSKNKNAAQKTSEAYFNLINLKMGINNSLDAQLVIGSLVIEQFNDQITKSSSTSFGDVALRLKQNIWGNDKGKTALSIMPFINFPTNGESKISGGIILPFALSLPNDWGFGAQIQADIEENQISKGHHFNLLSSVTLSHSLFKNCNFFVETFGVKDFETQNFEYFGDGGLIYELTDNLKIDVGINYGFKQESSKTYFLGLSFRH